MANQTENAGPDSLAVLEIPRKEAPKLDAFFSDVLGSAAPAAAVNRAIAESVRGRILTVRSEAGIRMVVPFEIAPDMTATLGVPVFHPALESHEAAVAAATEKLAASGARSVHIALECDSPFGDVLVKAGFTCGPRMVAMSGPVAAVQAPTQGAWLAYSPHRKVRFAKVFYSTLEGSLDFPELPACGNPVLLMRAFERRGEFGMEDFAVLEINGEPAGVMFVVMVGPSLEVAYTGVAPRWRKKGIGFVLMARAMERALVHRAHAVELMVDDRNAPAIALYTKFGLREKRAVRVYFRILKKS